MRASPAATAMTNETHGKDLEGLGVAVTGAAGDLGGAMALELAGRGAFVTMLDRVPEAEASGRMRR